MTSAASASSSFSPLPAAGRAASASPSPVSLPLSSTDDFLGGFQPQPLDVFQQHGVARSDDALQFARRIGRKDHPGGIAADARHADQMAEEFALGFGRETVEQLRVLAHDVMDVQTAVSVCSMAENVSSEIWR